MIPLLLVSNDSKITKKYLEKNYLNKGFIFEIKPELKEFSIKEIKDLFKETNIFHKELRIYLLENFHLSSIEAQNSFLKLLEEPPKNTQFILTTVSENKLLSTIVSRVKIVRLNKEKSFLISDKKKELLLKNISNKKFDLGLDTLIDLEDIIIYFKERLTIDKKAPIIIKECLKVKNLIENNNLNLQLAIDHILIFIHKQYTIKL